MGDSAKVSVTTFIDAAHRLPESLTKEGLTTLRCCRLHGHTYKIQVFVAGGIADPMICDFGSIKKVIDVLDHANIDEVFAEHGWQTVASTAENMCNFIRMLLMSHDITPCEIRIWEGYKGDNSNMVRKTYV
jgi:6-pyruvoyl-tetrahydropterin synthase